MIQLQLNNVAAAVNIERLGRRGGGNYLYDQTRTLKGREIMFNMVLKGKGHFF